MTAMQRRTALQLIGAGVGISLLAACTPAPSASTPPATVSAGAQPAGGAPAATSAPAANAAAQPKSGGTLRIGAAMDVNRLDPHFRLGDVYYQVYDRLTQYDQTHTPQPMLAESWDVSSDFTQIKFVLRKGVQFHNGRELDAAAVKFNSERARDLPNTQLDEAKWWTAIETPDKYTVVFKSDKPRPTAFDFFEYLNIAEPQAAGVNGPLSQELVMSTGQAEYTAFAQVIQNDLAKLGITVSIKVQDSAAYLETVNNWRYQGFWLGGGSFAHLDPTTAFVKSRALSVSGNSSAFTKPVNEAAVALVERGLSEADPAKRKQIYVELSDMLLDESYVIGMSPTTSKLMTTKKVHDLAPTLHSAQKWWDVWLG